MKTAILMSTFNGEKYLNEQIESLVNQTYKHWNLFIRDDGSIDHTIQIIAKWVKRDKRIHYINDDSKGLKPAASFLNLLKEVEADYYFFCDQDDYWKPNKLEVMLNNANGNQTIPDLVYCSLKCTDKNLIPEKNDFENLMGKLNGKSRFIGNDMPGCVMMINKKLRDVTINSYPGNNVIMHDWWLALIAEVFGNIKFLDKKLIYYRQHSDNSIGAGHRGGIIRKALHKDVFSKQENLVRKTYYQAKEFYSVFHDQLSGDWDDFLGKFVKCGNENHRYRLQFFNNYNLHESSKLRTLAYEYFFVFRLKNLLAMKGRN
ncbi:glycosyltransferase family 2 protein [Limosilactobacillus reuteri]|uniref:glycosyltransferase family 2 protein n=1 Tax=Limosilactobacillus reuteri TaxID=1598 RepID=UPI001E344AE0|nr:glycosyltransferase family 2 protein [Limosilactobacillus reuteri]MCC4384127.1 glycosyltransferase family 2 protein [Limosilactobacillus reuteri]MCC4419969.1 glycosyltransferase family 2 protein [Limosilactobacillus reuteri]MCC4421293.1 glycosyltransferase family 2 protein [Limosilactobacillus reuteri]